MRQQPAGIHHFAGVICGLEALVRIGRVFMKKLLTVALLLFALACAGQKTKKPARYINQGAVGFIGQYGHPFYELPEGTWYQPFLMGLYVHLPLMQVSGAFNYGMDIIPQFGLSQTDKINKEFGLMVNMNINITLSKNTIIHLGAGAGPHFIEMETARQANGFIFATNLLGGFKQRSETDGQHFEIGFYSGIRHISNAQTRKPNIGINNLLFGLSFARMF